ncbi:hypothetical protein O181_006825 [Austropuccinia psidii MF-1]|uniref:Uncharacterized protein n=1 Tax=Austropuccinia psidii MF-1 TaxID=1389203 RepID=A0A9Q3GH89_9BASI|nr:hypothetical protein [Austropuccinia psidii MF-1]
MVRCQFHSETLYTLVRLRRPLGAINRAWPTARIDGFPVEYIGRFAKYSR